MFDIGFIELVLIGVVGLVVIGPERLPGVASKLGRWVGRARHFIGTVKRDIDREIRQEELRQALDRDAGLDEIKSIINDTKYTIEDEVNEAKQDYVVKARDDDPGREPVADQNTLLKEQEEGDFDIDDYAMADTGHEDYVFPDDEPSEREQSEKVTEKQHGGRDDKAKG
jgi:sec-independent protein translocase protein TatB